MANALDYVDWRGDLSFDTVPVNEIDKYIFTCIGKPDYTGIIPADDRTVTVNEAVGSYFATHEPRRAHCLCCAKLRCRTGSET